MSVPLFFVTLSMIPLRRYNFHLKRILVISFLAFSGLVFQGLSDSLAEKPISKAEQQAENETAATILKECTEIIPTENLMLSGTLTVRKLRGIVVSENPFKLLMDWGGKTPSAEIMLLDPQGTSLVQRAIMTRPPGKPARIALYEGTEQKPVPSPNYAGRVMGTDMTWLDLSLDYLWWKDARFDDKPEGKSRNNRDCFILLTVPPQPIPGCAAMRIWVDKQLRCIMQAEQIGPQGNTTRRMWVQRVKKMNDRWMIRDMEIETLNSGHRTQLLVEDVAKP